MLSKRHESTKVDRQPINVLSLYNNFKLTWSATSCIKSQRGPREVADQWATSPRPTAKHSCESSVIVMNFGRRAVAVFYGRGFMEFQLI